jgi:alpha-amylase/alpha-mannosidase (GH57 family)
MGAGIERGQPVSATRMQHGIACVVLVLWGCSGEWGVTSGEAGPEGGPGPEAGFDVPGVEETGLDAALADEAAEAPEALDPGADGVPPDDDAVVGPDVAPDVTKPQVISAFSTDGTGVTVRFSEPLDPATATKEAFSVKASDGSILAVTSALPAASGIFVTLGLDPAKPIDPKLTYEVWVAGVEDLAGNPIDPKAKSAKIKRSVYLSIVWHQHQPFYADAKGEQLLGPWVRKHATKDYYDMAAILASYPDVHVTINLTAVMLTQLLRYYVEPMSDTGDGGKPLIDVAANTVDAAAFLARYRGRTDPWIDLLLDPTPDPEGILADKPTDRQVELYYNAPWTCLSTSRQIMAFFPQYETLRGLAPTSYTRDDLLLLKILFEVAWFDPDFLDGPVQMPDGTVVDLSDVVAKDGGGKYRLKLAVTEDPVTHHFTWPDPAAAEALANRLVAENYKVMRNVVGIHKKLRYDPGTHAGQVEIATTPFYHPILPLLVSTDLAKQGQPYDTLPSPAYSFPDDAGAQVAKAVRFYQDLFGASPAGMWPGEGSVAEGGLGADGKYHSVVAAFVDNGLTWIATDQEVLKNSLGLMGQGTPACYQCSPWRIDADQVAGDGGGTDDELAIVFRDTGLSNKVGFDFQGLYGSVAASEFMKDVGAMAPSFGGGDRLVVVVLDGENAWENYSKEHDGKGFFRALYKSLQDGYTVGEVVPVTVAEYLLGNPERNVPAHPVHGLKELEPLWAGSWIGATFGVWIGEPEENTAWGYLLKARKALELSAIPRPNPTADAPSPSSAAYPAWKAWEEMYAAEGSDWFWWYGDDMTSPANDDSPFDLAFRSHLNGMYTAMNEALVAQGKPAVAVPDFAPIVQAKAKAPTGPFPVAPVIDGKEDPPTEWADGGLFYDNDSGAVANPDDDVAAVKYGYTATDVYVAVEANEDLTKKLQSDYAVAIYVSQKHIVDAGTGQFTQNPFNTKDRWGNDLAFVTGGAAYEVLLDFTSKPAKVVFSAANGSGGWTAASGTVAVAGPITASGGTLIEAKLPRAAIANQDGDPLEFLVVAAAAGKAIDRAPNFGGKVMFKDKTNVVYVTFQADVTGNVLAIDAVSDIANPPPPKGKGIVYIAGNQDELGLWVPNKIGLRDDGVAPDAVAGDNLWRQTFGFMPGTLLRYKYTIGLPTDEGKFAHTEEFPLTERGLDVTKDPTCKKMEVRDVFADRPAPTGTAGPKTCVYTCGKLTAGPAACAKTL